MNLEQFIEKVFGADEYAPVIIVIDDVAYNIEDVEFDLNDDEKPIEIIVGDQV